MSKIKNKNKTVDTPTNKQQELNNMINSINGNRLTINEQHKTKKESLGPNTKR